MLFYSSPNTNQSTNIPGMSEITRRDICLSLPALSLLGSAFAHAQDKPSALPTLNHSRTFSYDQLPAHQAPSGSTGRPVLRGTLPTGEVIEMHETTLLPEQMPHPPHKHEHSEFMLIREGTVEFTANGKPEQVGPGGICFAASNEMHGLKNVGTIPANYFVIAIGNELAKS